MVSACGQARDTVACTWGRVRLWKKAGVNPGWVHWTRVGCVHGMCVYRLRAWEVRFQRGGVLLNTDGSQWLVLHSKETTCTCWQ